MKKGFSDDTFLARWLAGRLKADEKESFEQREDYSDFENIIKGIERLEMPDYSEEASWEKLLAKKQEHQPIQLGKRLGWKVYAAAASIALIIGLSLALFFSQQSIATQNNQKMAIRLPDNSSVHLNANSQLHYNSFLWYLGRHLTMEGEAFFEVEKGRKFRVKTPSGNVQVVGTSFNVWARNQQLEVSCYSGRVNVNSFNQMIQLTAGEQAYASAGALSKNSLPALITQPPWIQGESRFQEAPVREIIAALEQQFNIAIQYTGDLEKKLTLSFPHNNRDAALRLFSGALEANYELTPDGVVVIKPKD